MEKFRQDRAAAKARREEKKLERQRSNSSGHVAISRPSFGQWLKDTWLDLLTFLVMGAIGLGVYFAKPAPSRSFPIFYADGEIVYPEFAYPLRHEIVPIWAAALLATLIPIVVMLLMQIRIRSFWDANSAIIGLFYSVVTAAVFQVFLKWLIGGLRPHFLAVCKPSVTDTSGIPTLALKGNGFLNIMHDRTICTGDEDEIDDSLESFPSGHSTAAFAGFIYLYLYLNAKLKVWSNYHLAYWKLVAIYAPVLGAVLIAGSLTIDEYHNWYDVLAGSIIGTTMAFSAFRMVYASVWDFRFNHIPLRRTVPFTYGAAGSDIFSSAMFTRRAGWGNADPSAWGGAPFDAASTVRASSFGPGMGTPRASSGDRDRSMRHTRDHHSHVQRHSHSHGHRHSHGYGQGYDYVDPAERKPVPVAKYPHSSQMV